MDFASCCFICNIHLKTPYIQCAECSFICDPGHRAHDFVISHSEPVAPDKSYPPMLMEEVCSNDEIALSRPVNICSLCFSTGRSIGTHKSNHSYMIVRDDFQVFPGSSWTALEELTLLEAISNHGIGNWQNIAKSFTGRSAKECEKHYFQYYICGQRCGMPGTRSAPDMYSSFAPIKHIAGVQPPRPFQHTGTFSDMAGYSAARSDFITEYDNHAELLVKDIEFHSSAFQSPLSFDDEDDYKLDQQLKVTAVDIYRLRIVERERRKRIIKDHGLINILAVDSFYRSLLKCMKFEHVETLRRLNRLVPAEDFLKYLESLKGAVKLRQVIVRLRDYRCHGLTKFHHIKVFERLKSNRIEMSKRRTALDDVFKSLQDQQAWNKYINKSSIKEKLASGGALPHPSLSRRAPPPLDIAGLPGYEKLTPDEKELCSVARLVPNAYLDFKAILVNDCKKEGFLRLAKARSLIKIDVNKTRKIYDFLIKHNLINKDT